MDWFVSFFRDIWPVHMYFTVQILIAEMMFTVKQEKRSHPIPRFTFGIIFYLLISWFHPVLGFRLFRVLCIFAWSFLLLFFCIKVSARKCFFICIAAYAIQNLAYNAGDLARSILGLTRSDLLFFVVTASVFTVVYIISWLLVVQRFNKYGDVLIKNLRYFALAVATMIVVYGKNSLLSFGWLSDNELLILFAGISCVLTLVIQFSLLEQGRIEQENYVIEHLLNAEKESLDRLKKNIDTINMKCHDLRYHIAEYRKNGTPEMHDEFFRDIEQSVMIYDNTALTGNSTLDVLLTDRLLFCRANGIEVSYIVDTDVIQNMKKSDIYSLFSNAFDNAVQGVMVGERKKRFISLSVKRIGSIGQIVISNYCEKEPAMEDGLPISEGDPNYHGFGVRTIKYIAEKYGGTMLVDISENIFTLSILFPSIF